MLLPLCSFLLCRYMAKLLVVDLTLVLVNRTDSWKEEMDVELKRAKAVWKLPGTYASVSHCTGLQKDFQINGCCFHVAVQISMKFLFQPVLTQNHTNKEILGNIVCLLIKDGCRL